MQPRMMAACFTSAHQVAMSGSCRGILAWRVVCGVHPLTSVRVRAGQPSPSCLIVHPLVVAPPAVRFCVCPNAAPCARSCLERVRPFAQGRCGRCPPGSGECPSFCLFCFFCFFSSYIWVEFMWPHVALFLALFKPHGVCTL